MLYDVQLTAVCNVAVEAESEDAALDLAVNSTCMDDYEFIEGGPARLITDPGFQDAIKRHANVVLIRER